MTRKKTTKKAPLKTKIKKVGSKVKKITTKIGKVTKKIVVNSTVAPLIAPLVPFFPLMRNALKNKGITPPKAPLDLIKSFYSNIVQKSSFEGSIDDIPANLESMNENAIGAISAVVVKNIIEFIKNLKNKKAQGQKMSPSEDAILKDEESLPPASDIVQDITDPVKLKEGDENNGITEDGKKIVEGNIIPGKGGFFDKYKTYIIIGGVIVLVYFVFKK